MAVLPQVPGLSVHMQVAGQNLVEYPNPEPAGASGALASHCYVESNAGEKFAIEISVTPEFSLRPGSNHLDAMLWMDGANIGLTRNMKHLDAVRRSTKTLVLSTAYTGSDDPKTANVSHLTFVPVTTNDGNDGAEAHGHNVSQSLGKISVQIGVCTYSGQTCPGHINNVAAKESIHVPEKLLKGKDLAHGASFSFSHAANKPRFAQVTGCFSIGTFHFYYRSHEALQRQLIIPRSPSSSPVPTSGTVDRLEGLTQEEIRDLARERLASVKVEKGRSIKRERASSSRAIRPVKMVRLENGTEAIDLTDD